MSCDEPYIVVNYDALRKSLTSLGNIRKDFDETTKHTDALLEHLGQYQMADAMRQFGANWDRKRDDLVVGITKTEKFVTSVIAAFTEQDSECAKQFKKAQVTEHTMTGKEIAK